MRSTTMISQSILLLTLIAATLTTAVSAQTFNDARFQEVVEKLEVDVLELRDQVELLYTSRCASLQACQQANYDGCLSTLPSPDCPAGLEFTVPVCGTAGTCAGENDFSASTLWLPAKSVDFEGNPSDPRFIEAICFTRELDGWFTDKYNTDESYWSDFGFAPSGMYFGSNTGAFRIYPGVHLETCGSFDPRIRPWYVAGSSGRKNVVMVLDKSGSMGGSTLQLMKDAAVRVIDTLTIADRVAIVFFDNESIVLAESDQFLFQATEENRDHLKSMIASIEARGNTNFYDAFEAAFNVLDASINQELAVACNTAILFLTDGVISNDVPPEKNEAAVLALVKQRLAASSSQSGKPILLFTYSVSIFTNVDEFPSRFACSVPLGIWSKITDEDQLVEALSSYYLLFALGLGTEANSQFTTWVEPFAYAGSGIMGTTVSAPVYDRSKSPHLFLGVVGVDLVLDALDNALESADSARSIQKLAARSIAQCPVLELSSCELDFYRLATSGEDARCSAANCTTDDFVQTQDKECGLATNYPSNVFANTLERGKSFEERVCCAVGDGSGVCDATPARSTKGEPPSSRTGLIVGCVIGGLVAVALAVGIVLYRRKDAPGTGVAFGGERPAASAPPMPPPLAPGYQQ